MSLAFYKNVSPNNWYCEPNRLFQNLINGNPVVVGYNPPMKELVEKYGVGVSAETDGSDIDAIIRAIKQVITKYDSIKQNIAFNEKQWLWNIQDNTIANIITSLFKRNMRVNSMNHIVILSILFLTIKVTSTY